MATALNTEIPQLRAALRDLVALSTIPAAWVGRDPPAIAAGLADVLVGSLHLDFVFVRLCDPDGGAAVEVKRGSAGTAFPEWLERRIAAGCFSRREIVSNVDGASALCRGLVIPIGVGADGGLIAVASDRPDFPAEIDQLLVSVAANHAATAFQNARLMHERKRAEEAVRQARDDLELKVAERTAELQQAVEERRAHLRFLESLDRVNRSIQSTNDLERMMSNVLDVVLSIFDCDRAWLVYPCDPDALTWRASMEHTRPEFPGAFALGVELPVDEEIARVFRAGRVASGPVRFGLGTEQPVPPQLVERFGVQSIIAMAVYPRADEPYMFGLHQCSYPRVWTPQEERLFQEIGRRLADGLTTLLMFHNLSQSEARLADAQRIAHVAYWERDLDSGSLTCSDEGLRIVGLTPHDLPLSAAEIVARIHPADRPMQARALAEAIGGGSRYDMEYRVVRPNGDVRIVHSQGDVVRDESGRPRRMFGILQDLTERRGAEYLTRQVFETLPDGVCVISRDYRYRRVNPVYERYFKMPAETIVGMHLADHSGMEMFEQAIKPRLDRCFAGEEASYAEWVDGVAGHKYLSMTYSPLRSTGSDEVDGALVITRDLTEYMLASEALQQAQGELARVTRVTMLGEITASIAHEVNQPLAAVVMNGNACRRWLAADPPNLDEAREAAHRVVSDGERAGKIIARIRSLVRRGAPERNVLDINDVIREALGFTRSELERKGVAIRAELTEGLPAVLGDRVQLQQVVVNLALNGGDAMADLPAALRQLTVRSRHENGNWIVVEVQDHGKGINPEHADRLFEAFFSTKSGGLGMGLTISRSIIEMHGGKIWASNNEETGATMRFALPARSPSGGG